MIKKMIDTIKRYRIFIALAILNGVVLFFFPETGIKSLHITWDNMLDMLSVIPPIFILLGLLDVWVKRETMVKYMGAGSGFIGILLAFLIGSAAAGPLYAAFPVAGVLLKKGSKLSNVLIMLGAWSTTKIPLLLFEVSSLGFQFTLFRFLLNLFGIATIAWITEKLMTNEEQQEIYTRAKNEI